MAKDKKGKDRAEYPKLVKVGDKKVRVMDEAEEAALNKPKEPAKKATGWDKN